MTTHCHPIPDSDTAIGTDHKTIHTIFKIESQTPQQKDLQIPHKKPIQIPAQQKGRIKFQNLQIQKYKEAHEAAMATGTHKLEAELQQIRNSHKTSQEKADELFTTFTQTHLAIAEETLGKYEIRTKIHTKGGKLGRTMANLQALGLHIPAEYKQERADASEAYKSARCASATGQQPANMHEISQRYRKACNAAIQKAVQMQDELLTTEVTELCFTQPPQSEKNIWKYRAKRFGETSKLSLPPLMKGPDGNLLTSAEDSAKVWHATRSKIHGPHQTKTLRTTEALSTFQNTLRLLQQKSPATDDPENKLPLNTNFTRENLKEVINTLPTGKAAGLDEIPFELIKAIYKQNEDTMLTMMNFLWIKEVVPAQWNIALLTMLYKKGDKYNPLNYRGIVLVSAMKKLYEGLIRHRLQHHNKSTQCNHTIQHGFTPEHNLEECVFTLRHIIAAQHETGKQPTYVAFINFATAFPSTCRPALWQIMHKKGIIGRIWRNMQHLHAEPRGRVIHPLITQEEHFDFQTGLMEGSRLSPILYSYLIDTLVTVLKEKYPHIKLHAGTPQEMWIGALLYADDLALVATSTKELQNMLNTTQEWATNHFATINADKSKFMAFKESTAQQQIRRQQPEQGKIYLNNTSTLIPTQTEIQEVTTFCYLGVFLDPELNMDYALMKGIQSYWKGHAEAAKMSPRIGSLQPRVLTLLWRQLALSKLNNILPFLHTPKHEALLQQALQDSMLYLFCPKAQHKHATTKTLLADLCIPNSSQCIDIVRLRLFAHIATLAADTPARQIYAHWQTMPEDKIRRLPPYFFFQPLKHTLEKATIAAQWKQFTHTLKPKLDYQPRLASQRRHWVKSVCKTHFEAQKPNWEAWGKLDNTQRYRKYWDIAHRDLQI